MSKPLGAKTIGLFVVGAAALLIAGLLALGSGLFFRKTLPIVMFFDGNLTGLNAGAPVTFRGVRIGQVTEVFVRYNVQTENIRIPVLAQINPENIRFIGDLPDIGMFGDPTGVLLEGLIKRGLRAQLALPNFLTQQSGILLDFFPGTSDDAPKDAFPDRITVPTVPSTLQEVQATVQTVISKLSQLPLDQLIEDTRALLAGAKTLVNDPEIRQTITNTNAAVGELRQTIARVNANIDPLMASLQQTSRTADATLQTFRARGEQARALITDMERTFQSAEKSLQAAQTTLGDAQALIKTANGTLDPSSPLAFELVTTLRDVAAAARSLRTFTDTLERNPNAVLFGRQP